MEEHLLDEQRKRSKLNPGSQKLLKDREERSSSEPRRRPSYMEPRAQRLSGCVKNFPTEDFSFRPSIDATSEKIDKSLSGPSGSRDRVDRLLQYKSRCEARREEEVYRQQRDKEEECTFRPRILRTHGASGRASADEATARVAERGEQVQQKRQEWVRQQRREKIHQEMEECTFRPFGKAKAKAKQKKDSRPKSAPHQRPQHNAARPQRQEHVAASGYLALAQQGHRPTWEANLESGRHRHLYLAEEQVDENDPPEGQTSTRSSHMSQATASPRQGRERGGTTPGSRGSSYRDTPHRVSEADEEAVDVEGFEFGKRWFRRATETSDKTSDKERDTEQQHQPSLAKQTKPHPTNKKQRAWDNRIVKPGALPPPPETWASPPHPPAPPVDSDNAVPTPAKAKNTPGRNSYAEIHSETKAHRGTSGEEERFRGYGEREIMSSVNMSPIDHACATSPRQRRHTAPSATNPTPPRFDLKSSVDQQERAPTPERVLDWTVRDVQRWVQSLGLPVHSSAFSGRRITGHTLLHLTPAELESTLGITHFGARKRILMALGHLRSALVPRRVATHQRQHCTKQASQVVGLRRPLK